jgi:hypothetical protein
MNNYITPIDITNIPALRHIVAEMKNAKQPRLLKQNSETVAMLMPMGTALEESTKDIWAGYHPGKAQQAVQQSAGTLEGVNQKKLLDDIAHEHRKVMDIPSSR